MSTPTGGLPSHDRRGATPWLAQAEDRAVPGHWEGDLVLGRGGKARIATIVDFAGPCSSWQRGTDENTNGLLRHHLPRSLDVSTITDTQLDATAAELNERPCETLGWASPSEKFSEFVAMAA